MKNPKIFPRLLELFLLLTLTGCEKNQSKYISENQKSILSVYASSNSVEADGMSFISITASISKSADLKLVYFLTTSGIFLDSNKTAININAAYKNDSLLATVRLQSGILANPTVKVDVSVPDLDTTLIVNFIAALPDFIHVESSSGSIPTGFNSTAPVSATLIRTIGKPSLHQIVLFQALTDNGQSIGEFTGISSTGSDSSGSIKSTFLLKDTTYIGRVRIVASVSGKAKQLTDTTTIFITK